VSGPPRPGRPGDLGEVDRAELAELAVAARRSHDWGSLADRLVRLRASGVAVAALCAVVGVGESRLRVVCREHGPDPATVRDPLTDAGWVDTAAAARAVLGVSVARLLEHTVRAEGDGVAVMVGWTRLWHGPSLPGWWAAQQVDTRPAARARQQARSDRVRRLVTAGATVAVAAAEVGVDPSSAYRYLQLGPGQELAVTVLRTRVRVAGRASAGSGSGWGPLAENRSGLPTTPTTKR